MFENIKVDIIYYKTNTDFELEFNLCGCCRMRLLTDKVSDQKSFVHMLARGVSRSRVIIVIGSLFGNDGIMGTVARAINKNLTVINNKSYGIPDDDEIKIIDGSTPLVTGEGYFGGCIIESGPQTMILLTDSKNVRKSIMHSLIHPYIEELSSLALKEKAKHTQLKSQNTDIAEKAEYAENSESDVKEAPAKVSEENEVTDDTQQADEYQFITNPSEDSETEDNKPLDESDKRSENDVELGGGMIFTTERDNAPEEPTETDKEMASQIYTEPKRVKYTKKSYYAEGGYPTDTKDYVFDDDEFVKQVHTPKHSSLSLAILILTIVLLLTAAVLCLFIFIIPAKEGVSVSEYLGNIFSMLRG